MSISPAPDRIPVTVLTGFLGSGKTTLLRRLLAAEGMARTAVVINEFGEIGLDHLLVRSVTENAVVLQNGCICCSIRSDIRTSFRELIDGRGAGSVPLFDRIILETTGLADPVPIVQTLTSDPMLRHCTRLSNIVTTVDAVNGIDQMDARYEPVRQAALADRIVVTKSDIAPPGDVAHLQERLAALNPAARRFDLHADPASIEELITEGAYRPKARSVEVQLWLASTVDLQKQGGGRGTAAHSHHDETIRSFVFRTDRHIDWTVFGVWLSALVHRHGRRMLRTKGLLNVPNARGPVMLNAVQHIIHPPIHLEEWPDTDRSSRIVFIVDGLEGAQVCRSLEVFLEHGASGDGAPHMLKRAAG